MAGRAWHADQTLWMQEREEEGERGTSPVASAEGGRR